MIGSIIGDVVGSSYEYVCPKTTEFDLFPERSNFTDDSVMTLATAYSTLNKTDYGPTYRAFGREFPAAGYGGMFNNWLFSNSTEPYNSYGNGSAMRVSPVGYAFNDPKTVLIEAKKTAIVTHNHAEGVKGAQATALAIFLARKGCDKEQIRSKISDLFTYNLSRTCDDIRPTYMFNESCQETVPQAIVAFLDSNSFEHAIRLAISLGGDADTLACITGGIAQAFYDSIPRKMAETALKVLPKKFLRIIKDFNDRYDIKVQYEIEPAVTK